MASPICLVKPPASGYITTDDGVNVAANVTVDIKLQSVLDVSEWYLRVLGTDETISFPVISGVNPITNKVFTPSGTPSCPMGGFGTAIIFESTVISNSSVATSTTFGLYVLTQWGYRVGAGGERIEGDTVHGWITKVNPVIREFGKPDPTPTFNGFTIDYACGSYVNVYDTVYLAGSEFVDQADASSVLTSPAAGIVVAKPTTTTATVMHSGEVTSLTGLTVGSNYFLGPAPGALSSAAPTSSGQVVQALGRAISSSKLLWMPSTSIWVLG